MQNPDNNADVLYYKVDPSSDLYQQYLDVHEKSQKFVEKANAYAKQHGALGWTFKQDPLALRNENNFPQSAHVIDSFRFENLADVPQGWSHDGFGRFKPPGKGPTGGISLPTYQDLVDDPRFRFHKLGDEIILASLPDEEGLHPSIENASPIDQETVAQIIRNSPAAERDSFSLNTSEWNHVAAHADQNQMTSQEQHNKLLRIEHSRFWGPNRMEDGYVPNPEGLEGKVKGATIRFLNTFAGPTEPS